MVATCDHTRKCPAAENLVRWKRGMKSQLQATKYCIYDLKAMMLSPVLTTKKDVGVRKKKEEESCAGIPFKGHVAVRLSGDSANLGVRERRRHTKERLQIYSNCNLSTVSFKHFHASVLVLQQAKSSISRTTPRAVLMSSVCSWQNKKRASYLILYLSSAMLSNMFMYSSCASR